MFATISPLVLDVDHRPSLGLDGCCDSLLLVVVDVESNIVGLRAVTDSERLHAVT